MDDCEHLASHCYCLREAKSQGPTFTFKCPILDKQKQILFGSSFRAQFPHSAQLSSLMESATQPNRSCLLRLSKWDQFSETEAQEDGHC